MYESTLTTASKNSVAKGSAVASALSGTTWRFVSPSPSKKRMLSDGSLQRSAAYTVRPHSRAKSALVSPAPLPRSSTTEPAGMLASPSSSSQSLSGLGPMLRSRMIDVGKEFAFGKFMVLSCSVRIQRNIGIRNVTNQGQCSRPFAVFGSSVPYRTMTKKTSPRMAVRAEPHAPCARLHITTFTTRFAVLNCTGFRGIRHCPRFPKG